MYTKSHMASFQSTIITIMKSLRWDFSFVCGNLVLNFVPVRGVMCNTLDGCGEGCNC